MWAWGALPLPVFQELTNSQPKVFMESISKAAVFFLLRGSHADTRTRPFGRKLRPRSPWFCCSACFHWRRDSGHLRASH